MKKHKTIIIIFLFFYLIPNLSSQEKPVVAVLDFASKKYGFYKKEFDLLVETLSHALMEKNCYHVIGKRERNRLLHIYNYRPGYLTDMNNFKELGEKLFADFIIGGSIQKEDKTYILTLSIFNVYSSEIIFSNRYEYPSVQDIINSSRDLSVDIINTINKRKYPDTLTGRILDTLSPVTLKERMLFILPKGTVPGKQAERKKILTGVLSHLLNKNRFIIYTLELPINESGTPPSFIDDLLNEWDCHYIATIELIDGSDYLIIYGGEQKKLLTLQLYFDSDETMTYVTLADQIETKLPPLPFEIVVKEIKENIAFESKLQTLLFSEQLLSHHFALSIYQTILKSTFIHEFHPLLSIFSMEMNVIWYYNRMFGAGLGYGYSYNYPGTFDDDFINHPPVHQHEILFIPLSIQTGGNIGFIIQAIFSLNFHNTYYYYPEAVYEDIDVIDEITIVFSKIGINIGFALNISDFYSIYWKGITFQYGIPFSKQYEFPDTDIQPLSFDIGSIGFIIRF